MAYFLFKPSLNDRINLNFMQTKTFIVIILVILVVYVVWQQFIRDDFDLPRGGETSTEIITIEEDVVVEEKDVSETDEPMSEKTTSTSREKEIMVTDGVRHSVALSEIRGGGPPNDGIPSIDDPKFISPDEASAWLSDSDPGIAVSVGDEHHFYPYQILVWHEIVNDTIGGKRILVTYCPLCLTGIVFDPVVNGERVEFGTSGKLWKSNLVMYDRLTDSLWSQVLGEAIVGEKTGSVLTILSSDQMRFGEWKKEFSSGVVLSRDTGTTRFYGDSPYGDYFDVVPFALSLANATDDRLPNDALIFGIVIGDKAKAYSVDSVKEKGEVTDVFEGTTIVLRYDSKLDVVRMFEQLSDGTEERINPVSGFWFSWAAARPDTEVYK